MAAIITSSLAQMEVVSMQSVHNVAGQQLIAGQQ